MRYTCWGRLGTASSPSIEASKLLLDGGATDPRQRIPGDAGDAEAAAAAAAAAEVALLLRPPRGPSCVPLQLPSSAAASAPRSVSVRTFLGRFIVV